MRRYTDRSIGGIPRLKNSKETHKQNNSSKGSHLVKGVQPVETGNSVKHDESYSSIQQYNAHIPVSQTTVERGPVALGTSLDPRYTFQNASLTTLNVTDSSFASSECASRPKFVAYSTSGCNITVTPYDATVPQASIPQLHGYVSGMPCTIPDCSICHSLITPLPYMTAQFASRLTTQSSLFAPSVAAGPIDPDAGGTDTRGPCYVWIGQPVAAQKQLIQTQLAMSHLGFGLPTTMASSSSCSVNTHVHQLDNTGPSNVPITLLQDSTNNIGKTAHPTQQVPISHIIKEPGSSTNCFNDPSVQNPVDSGVPSSSSPGSADSSRPGHLGYGGSVVERTSTVPPDALVNSNIGWTATNYLGPNALWLPPTYTQHYFQPLPLPIGSVSPAPVIGFNDPMMLPRGVGRPYRSSERSSVSVQSYYTPATNFFSVPAYTNAVKLPLPKAYNPVHGFAHPTVYSTAPMVTAATQPLSSAHWLLLWNALAASKQSAGLLQAHPLSPYGVPLDRSGLTRRRANASTTTRSSVCKGFDLTELAALRLSVNPIEFDVSILFRARFFVIKSDCEYNVHQSIRHGVWCSTRAGNQCLDEAYQSVQPHHFTATGDHSGSHSSTSQSASAPSSPKEHLVGHVLLIFSTRSSGYLSGVAEMVGPVNPQKKCSIWQDSRFRGEIPVRWIYVKNVPNNLVKHILIESYDNRPVTVLRDTSEILPAAKGEELLRIIHNHNNSQSPISQYHS